MSVVQETAVAGVAPGPALRATARRVFAGSCIRWTVAASGDTRLAWAAAERAVRIGTEAMRNVRAHAFATTVVVAVTGDENGVEFAVIDNGVGPGTGLDGGRGVCSMRAEACETGGWWCAEATPTGGTTIRFRIPRP